MIHRGEIVEKAIRSSGMAITQIAKKLGIDRRTIYNKFDEANLSLDTILEIGKVINYDFANDFPELGPKKNISEEPQEEYERTPMTLHKCQEELLELQKKYISVLEENNRLLKESGNYRRQTG